MSFYVVVLFCISLLTLSGCSEKRPEGMPKLYPCTVSVIQDGKPLSEASISLIPVDSSSRWASGGLTNESGKAEMQIFGKYKGAAPGKYYLCINKTEEGPISSDIRQPGSEATEPDIFDLIAPKFGDIDTAQIVEVVENRKNAWTVDVGSAVRILIPKR